MNSTAKFTSSPSFFEEKYQEKSDPWNFANDAYELSRYDAIIAALSHQRYRYAFEPGCSVGVLTERLAAFCDKVLAVDFSPTAAAQAKARCSHLEHVTVRCASLAEESIETDFDLLVLCEIGYYFSQQDWQAISSSLIRSMREGGVVLAAHWLGNSEDHSITGDDVHTILRSNPQLQLQYSERNQAFRLDRWIRQ
jgi:SAM-dependent methyltransferase